MQKHVLDAAFRSEDQFHGVCVRAIGITPDGDGKFPALGDRDDPWPHGLEPGEGTQFFYDGIGPVDESRMPPTDRCAMHMTPLVSESHVRFFRTKADSSRRASPSAALLPPSW